MLRTHPDFRRLWIGETISMFGTQVGMLAVPLTAVLTLHASAFEVSALTTASYAAFLLIGLPAGAWVDRMARRPVLIAANVARAVLYTSVPAAAVLGVLGLTQLYLVVFAAGIASVFFEVGYQSYLPALVGRDRLVDGNSRLEASRSVAYAAGPSVAGALVELVTAPVAILADAASFAWSAGWIAAIRGREPTPSVAREPLRREIAAGVRVVFGHPILRAVALYNASVVLCWSLERSLAVVFLVRTVHLSAGGIGVLYSVASLGAVLGAFVAAPLRRRLGTGRILLLAASVSATAMLLIPLTALGPRLALYALGAAANSAGVVVYNVVCLSLRQQLCPDELLGRMNGTMRFISWGMLPPGSLLAGVLATTIGLRPTLWLGAVAGTLAVVWLLRSPLSTVDTPAPPVPA